MYLVLVHKIILENLEEKKLFSKNDHQKNK